MLTVTDLLSFLYTKVTDLLSFFSVKVTDLLCFLSIHTKFKHEEYKVPFF